MINNDTLEMLMSREQLMCDIDGIIEEFACNNIISEDVMKSLTRVLCDSVCRNFPTMWHKPVGCLPIGKVSQGFGTDPKIVYCRVMNKTTSQTVFETLYDFVEEMQPDFEMCLDFCESQGITITDDVCTVIGDLLWNKENS